MALAKTNLSPEEQIRSMITYDDQLASGSGLETGATTLNDDMSSVFSQLNRILNSAVSGNDWYNGLVTPSALDTGSARGVNSLNSDLHLIERKRILKRVSRVGTDVGVATSAAGTLTATANFTNTETVTLDTKTYTFQTTLTDVDGNVQIGGDLATSLQNLQAAINLGAGAGTAYATATTLHPTVFASAVTATTLVATAKTQGTAGNSIASTETAANASWGGATLSGGGGATDVIVLTSTQLPGNTTAAIGSVTTLGVVVATAATFGTGSLDEVTGSNPIQPKNLWVLVDASTGEPLARTGGSADGKQVYGLGQVQSSTDGSTITGAAPDGMQISLVVRTASGADLELISAGDVPATATIDYAWVVRDAFEDCPEEAWLGDGFTDGAAVADTRQTVYDNQGASPFTTTSNATVDLGTGLSWEIGDAASAALMTFAEDSSGSNTVMTVGSDVDVYNNNAIDVNFNNGITADNGSNAINVGVTADQIDFTGNGTVTASSSSTVTVTATSANATLSTVTSGNVVVSSAGNVTVDGVGVSIDGTSASNLTATGANLTVSTATSGILELTAAGLMDVNAAANLDIDVTGTYDMLSTGAFSIDGTGASNVSTVSGDLALSTATSGSVLVDGISGVEINSSAGALALGNDANTGAINIGTGAAARTLTMGNATGATALDFNAGTGGITVDAVGAISIDSTASSNLTMTASGPGEALTIVAAGVSANLDLSSTGNTTVTSSSSLLLDSSGPLEINSSGSSINLGNDGNTGAINIGTGAAARTINIGNALGGTAIDFFSGTGNFAFNSADDETSQLLELSNTTGLVGLFVGNSDPNGTISGAIGSLFIDTNGALWQNTTGGTVWVQFDAAGATNLSTAITTQAGTAFTAGAFDTQWGITDGQNLEIGDSSNVGILTVAAAAAGDAVTVDLAQTAGGATFNVTDGSNSLLKVTATTSGDTLDVQNVGTVNLSTGAVTADINIGNSQSGTTVTAVAGTTTGDADSKGWVFSEPTKFISTVTNVDANAATNAGVFTSQATYQSFENSTEGNLAVNYNTGYNLSTGTATYWVTVVAGSTSTATTISAFTNNGAATDATAATAGAATFTSGQFVLVTGGLENENRGIYQVVSHAANVLTLAATPSAGAEFIHQQVTTTTGDSAAVCLVTLSVMRVTSTGDFQIAENFSTDTGITYVDMGTSANLLSTAITNQAGTAFTSGSFDTSWGIANDQFVEFGDALNVGILTVHGDGTSSSAIVGTGGNTTAGAGQSVDFTGGTATTATQAGGAVTLAGGVGNTTGAGGALSLTGGVSGAGATGDGGALTFTGGAAGSTNGDGGAITIDAGALAGTGTDGAIHIGSVTAGQMLIGIDGTGTEVADSMDIGSIGAMSLKGQDAISISSASGGASGAGVTITAGAGSSSAGNIVSIVSGAGDGAAAFGGNITLLTGAGVTSGDSGSASINTAQANATSGSNSGAIQIRTGANGGVAASGTGEISIKTGNAVSGLDSLGLSGNLNLSTGSSGGAAVKAGAIALTSGGPTGAGVGAAGDITLAQGASAAASGDFGTGVGGITLTASTNSGTASAGNITLNSGANGSSGAAGIISLVPAASSSGTNGYVTVDSALGLSDTMLRLDRADGTSGVAIDMFVGSVAPESNVTGNQGDLYFRDGGTSGDQVLYVKGTGDATNTGWSALQTTATAVTRQFFQTTMTATVAPGSSITSAEITGTMPTKPSSNFLFDIDAEIYLNGVLLMNGTLNEVASGSGDNIDVSALGPGPTFRSGDVITIIYHTNSTAG